MKTPLLAVDSIILFEDGIVLISRRNPPFQGCYALPGGFVEIGETTEDAIIREAKEETGLEIDLLRLIGVYSDPHRDIRGHVVSICYLSSGSGKLAFGSDAKSARVFCLDNLPNLAFDHAQMINDAMAYIDPDSNEDHQAKHIILKDKIARQ
jgi:8-oxo-dGTP diphosphatase